MSGEHLPSGSNFHDALWRIGSKTGPGCSSVNSLPKSWITDRPANDYGIDLRVEIFDRDDATGQEFLVQLKASAVPVPGNTERMRLDVSTFNYLRANLAVVMLVKFVARSNEGYWMWLRDVPVPANPAQQTMMVRIPKANRVSAIRWRDIQRHVERVRDAKLAAGIELQRRRRD